MYRLGLNFSALKDQDIQFQVYRKRRQPNDKKRDSEDFGHRLPKRSGDKDYENYWVTFQEKPGYTLYTCDLFVNHSLTKRYLTYTLLNSVASQGLVDKVKPEKKSKNNRINFIIKQHPEGNEIVWLEPYILKGENKIGFLIDFKFQKKNGIEISRRLQILSLSLNSIGRSNKELASDKYNKIKEFARQFYKLLFNGTKLDFDPILEVESAVLNPKRFVCSHGTIINHQSQMRGIGPYKQVDKPVNVIFLHKESERQMLSGFYKSLERELSEVFKCSVNFHGHISKIIDKNATDSLKAKIKIEDLSNVVVVVLKKNELEDNEMYYRVKYEFCTADIPVQFINYDTLKNKFSVRDFSLQIFSKIGGVPWIVDTDNRQTLIVGLAQSIHFEQSEDSKEMERYYAYSIIMDNSGLFHSINIVSENVDKAEYLEKLRLNIADLLSKNIKTYSDIVIHAPFRISKDEINKIKQAISAADNSIRLIILRLNQYNKYYGYNKNVNSLVPYESSLMPLDKRSYLLWTEGITKINRNPNKRYGGPIFVEVMFETDDIVNHVPYMQDLVNLSGMNWRAYNSKAEPLSIQYCNLVSDFVKEFRIRGYPKLTEDNLKPWFL